METEAEAKSPCTPSFLESSGYRSTIEFEMSQFSFSYVLIGCKEKLESVSPEEQGQIRTALEDVAKKWNFALAQNAMKPDLREGAVEAINLSLGREVASDIAILNVESRITHLKR